MVLAAGLGTRLRPLTDHRAKPAVPFMGAPLVRRLVEQLHSAGCREPVVNTHHLPRTVLSALEGLAFVPSHEPNVLGTAGGIGFALARGCLDRSRPVIVVNGKLHTSIDFAALVRAHQESEAAVTMALVPNRLREAFREVFVEDGRVVGFGLGRAPQSEAPLAFTGIQVLAPEVLARLAPVPSDTVRDVFPALIAERRVRAQVVDARWWEFSTPERYLGLHLRARREGLPDPSAGTGRARDCVVWPDVDLSPERALFRCVVLCPAPPELDGLRDAVIHPGGVLPLDPALVDQAAS